MNKLNKFKEFAKRTPIIREIALFLLRTRIAAAYLLEQLSKIIDWLLRSREAVNFTYDLTDLNKQYLASLIAGITSRSFQEISAYMQELEDDGELRRHIEEAIRASNWRHFADTTVHYGRRLGWYAVARAIKPRVIVETGVDKGLGSCVLTSALIRNEQEGMPGHYYGTDINPNAGFLLDGKYRRYGEVLYGDSILSLEKLEISIDLFVNDSDHSAHYEAREYQTISGKLSPGAILLGDNSHSTSALLEFSLTTGRQFVFFQEKPLRHWYPGAGIGISFRR